MSGEDSARNKMLTMRLEPALRKLSEHPEFPLAYLAKRFGADKGELAEWLGTFNGGSHELKLARIETVKVEVGLITTGRLSAAKSEKTNSLAPAVTVAAATTETINGDNKS